MWSGETNELKNLNQKQSTYDNCGLNVNDSIKIQSIAYKNYTEFFTDVKPPFFSDYKIIFKDGIDGCFNNAKSLTISTLVMLTISLITLIA